MSFWGWGTFYTGYSLAVEFNQGTLDHNLVSRTPLMLIMFGKALGAMTSGIPGGLLAFLLVLLVTRDLIEVSNPVALVVALGVAMVSIIVMGFTLTPLFLLSRGRPGLFNAILPLGIVLSGFLYPVSLFSSGVEVVARFLPTSWAMEGVIRSVDGGTASWAASDVGIALGLSLAYLVFTYFLFRKVEHRIRVTGSLGSF